MKAYLRLWVLIVSVCSGCASITDRHQYVRVIPPQDSTLYYDNEKLSQGQPTTIRIVRTAKPQYTLKRQGHEEQKTLNTHYRWGQSFGGNALMLYYAPLGWLVDLMTGAAWETRDEVDPSREFKLNKNSRLFILPPTGMDSLNSQQVGREITRWFQIHQPGLHALPFESSYYKALALGFDHESSILREDMDGYSELLYDSHATHLVFSHYDEDKKILQLKVFSPYSEKTVAQFDIKDIKPQQTKGRWSWLVSETFEVFPNTISLGVLSTNFDGCAYNGSPSEESQVYCADRSKKTPFNFFSSISLTNVMHFRKRVPWRLYLRFFPDLNVNFNQVEFSKANTNLPNLHLDWAFFSIGYGPRVSFILPVGEIFLEVIPIFAMNYLRLYSSHYGNTQWVGKGGAIVQVGLNSWLSNRWNLRLFTKGYSQDLLPGHNIDALSPNTQFSGGLSILQSGISIGYYFNEEKARLFSEHGLFSSGEDD